MKMNNGKYLTDYYTAVHWFDNALILCNNIGEIDPSVYDNCRFGLWYYTDDDGNVYDNEDDYEGDGELYENQVDIYQWFLTNCTEGDVEFLEEHFGLLFTYSELLDLYVLCVDHYGTMWRGVDVYTDLANAAKK